VKFAFGRLAVLVRRRVADQADETRSIVPGDFHVAEGIHPDALDLIALCRR
jgi:hypothetical protein